jgi:hypothetical protein
VSSHNPGYECWLIVHNDYQFIGQPSAAGMTVYVDGKRAGIAPLGENLDAAVEPGRHKLRVRLWYFLSPSIDVDVKPGETRRFRADIPRTLPWWPKMRGLVDPFHWLLLEETSQH